jgi:GTPase SAR1 family protein
MAKKNYDLLFKLLLIGDSGVGKVSEKKRRIEYFICFFSF